MANRWRKLGQLYCPEGQTRHPKLLSHAANPLPVLLHGNVFRVFYSGRDASNRSSVGAVDIDIKTLQIVDDHAEPFFQHGPEGSFYESGVSIGNQYGVDGRSYIGFMGWQNPPGEHWRGDIGRLRLTRDFRLEIEGGDPLMTVDAVDPISLSYPWIQRISSGDLGMWYGSTRTWDAGNGEMLHVINYASSTDGEYWQRHGLVIPFELGAAQAFSRPTIAATSSGDLEMWFCYRGNSTESYRIGYARSDGGKQWELSVDESGIRCSSTGWDSEMLAYPFVFDHADRRYMLYNGNGYGMTGFGIAVLERNKGSRM